MSAWKTKDELKPVLVLCSTMILFPLGYFFCAFYYRMNMAVSILMLLSLSAIGFVLVNSAKDIIDVIFLLNMLSAGFILSYLSPLSEIRFIEKRMNKAFLQKLFVTIVRILTLVFLLIPAAIVPINMAVGNGGSIELNSLRGDEVFNLSHFEAEVIAFFTFVWFVLAVYSYFKPSSYFLTK